MSRIISARDRLEQASDLPAVLDGAYDAFEAMRLAFRAHEDPATGLFAPFVMAAAAAADGRDAVAFAPSLPLRHSHNAPTAEEGPGQGQSAEGVAGAAVGLSQVLAGSLMRAAGSASDPGDRAACEQAAACAHSIRDLLGGTGP
jgi:hypothetical protein